MALARSQFGKSKILDDSITYSSSTIYKASLRSLTLDGQKSERQRLRQLLDALRTQLCDRLAELEITERFNGVGELGKDYSSSSTYFTHNSVTNWIHPTALTYLFESSENEITKIRNLRLGGRAAEGFGEMNREARRDSRCSKLWREIQRNKKAWMTVNWIIEKS